MNSDIKYPVLLFDGVCNLCNRWVQWVLLHDRQQRFRFAALQSETGQRLLLHAGLSAQNLDTVVLVDGDRIFTRSDVALAVVQRIGGIWALFAVLKVIPRPVRDALYDLVARYRYRWFGKKQSCMIPQPEWKDRFL